MAIFKGKRLTVELYGESHGDCVGAKVSGFPAFTYDERALARFMARRKASASVFSTARLEADEPIFEGVTGTRIEGDFSLVIPNCNTRSQDYADLYGKPRPAHADYAWYVKDGVLDFAGGGRFSARLTAPFAAVGGLCKQVLSAQGVGVYAYVVSIGQAVGTSYRDASFDVRQAAEAASFAFPAISGAEDMLAEIAEAKAESDSVGGKIECVVTGFPAGVGDHLFEGLEGKIASLVYAVPAVKGVSFGSGFDLCRMRGSAANDPLYYDAEGNARFATNHQGGVNGGISNGNYISLSVAVKPTPSIAREQRTVDLVTGQNTTIRVSGRHDACVVPRAVPVVEAAVAIALLDELSSVPPHV